MFRTRKRIAAIVALLAVIAIAWISLTPSRIQRYDRAFLQVTRGMDESRVLEVMGQPDSIDLSADQAFWDDEPLLDPAAREVRRQYWYKVSTFFLPISWTVGFDKDGKVISKHRWD